MVAYSKNKKYLLVLCLPVDGVWTEWTDWDECPVTCGGSLQNRTRECTGPFHGGANCTGPEDETQECNIEPCPSKTILASKCMFFIIV